jgi:hypothetical protein
VGIPPKIANNSTVAMGLPMQKIICLRASAPAKAPATATA